MHDSCLWPEYSVAVFHVTSKGMGDSWEVDATSEKWQWEAVSCCGCLAKCLEAVVSVAVGEPFIIHCETSP